MKRMPTHESQPEKARVIAARLAFAALNVLKENGSEMRGRQVIEEVEKRVKLGEWEKQRYEKSGYIRWRSILHFYSIDLIKAGFLVKKKGIWFLTPEGDSALKLGATGLMDAATKAYREWRQKNPRQPEVAEVGAAGADDSVKQEEVSA